MKNDYAHLTVTGDKAVARAFLAAERKEVKKAMKDASKAAAEVVVPAAKEAARERDGRLRASIRAGATQKRGGYVQAGSPARVPYAGVQHFGWPAHGIEPNPFIYEALDERIGQVRDAYVAALDNLTEKLSAK